MRATEFIIEAANPKQQAAIAIAKKEEQGVAEGGAKDRQWSNKDMERLRVATRDFDDIMASDGPEATKQNLIKKRIQTKPMAGPKGVLPEQDVAEDWQKVNKSDKTDGMSGKAVKAYRRENPGSKLKTAVTTKPSKLKKGGKAASRRKSFCARMGGMKKHNAGAKTKRDPDSPINKALRRWNCESVEQLQELVMIAEQFVQKSKK